MGEVFSLLRPEFAIDLNEADVAEILNFTSQLPGRWRAKITRAPDDAGSCGHWWAYIFNAGPVADVFPVFTVSRTSRGYAVVWWDVLKYSVRHDFASCRVPTVGAALAAVQDAVRTLPRGKKRNERVDNRRSTPLGNNLTPRSRRPKRGADYVRETASSCRQP